MENITKFEKVSLKQFEEDLNKNQIVLTNIEEIYNKIELPKRATISSAGYDFKLPFDIEIKPNESIIIPTGIRVKMNDDLVLQIYPRSSLGFKYRMQLDNTVGIIDSDYYYALNEGHIMIKVSNLSHEQKNIILKANEGFAQGLFIKYYKTVDDEVTSKRTGGFGSTNK